MVNGLYSPWRSVTGGVLQRPILGPVLFSIFISDLEGMTQCTLSKFADDTSLGGPVNMLEGRAAFQDRQERDLQEIQQGQKQSPAPGKEDPLTSIQAGERLPGELLCGKGFWDPWGTVSWMLDSSVAWQQRWPVAFRTVLTGAQAADQRRELSPLLSTH